MSKLALIAACLLMTANAEASEIPLQNPDFETPIKGKRIPGWARTQHAGVRAYEISTDKETHAKGKASIRMLRTTEQTYGLISQELDSDGLAGKPVELIAALKAEEVGKMGWVMVLTFKNHSEILDQVRAEPIVGDTGWKDVAIKKVAPPGTNRIQIGFMLLDGGTGWADNVRLRTIDGDKLEAAEPEANLPGTGEPSADRTESVDASSKVESNQPPTYRKSDD